MKKVIIVGAGTAGLGAAVRLAAAGYEVEVFEKNPEVGGKMYQIRQEGYRFDVGPTLVMMPEIYESVFEAAGTDPGDYIPMTRLEPMYKVFFNRKDFPGYAVSGDLVALTAMLEGRSPETARGFYAYLAEIYKRYRVAYDHFIRRPFRSWRDIYNPRMLKKAYELKTFSSAEGMMARFIKDPDVQQMMSFQTLYIGVSPKKGPSLYNIIPMIELLYGVWTIKGGMHTMAESMARVLEELGGRIHLNTPVEEILIEGGKVRGVRAGGADHEADYVISNGDFPYTMKHLIRDRKDKGKYTDEKIDRMDYSCSCLVFYWGMSRSYPEADMHTFIVSSNLEDNLDRIFDGRYIPDASVYLSIPSRGDASMAPEGKDAFYVLIPVSELSTAKYEFDEEMVGRYREQALEKLSKMPGLENVREEIVCETVMRPQDFKERFNAYHGATFGLQPTLRQSNHWRPQAKSKAVEGLYFCGSSVHPGAGVPIALESGKIAAEELRRDEPGDSFR